MASDKGRLAFARVWLVACLLAIYAGSAGLGFVKDDFGWILHSRISSGADVVRYFTDPQSGFFRPLVALSFGLSEPLFGLNARWYGLTNLALVVAIAFAIARLGTALGFAAGPALLGGAVWSLNFHGIGMAVLWISGRTSLLLTLFAVLAATEFVKGRPWRAGMLVFCALLAKEEPVALPFVFLLWGRLDRRGLATSLPSMAALVAYLALRTTTDAMTPGTAPGVYALTSSPGAILSNAVSYADRSLTFAAAVLVLAVLAFGRAMPRLTGLERTTAIKGAVWIAGGFAVTIMLPIRSSLYAVYPSVGTALIVMAAAAAAWRAIPDSRRRPAIVALFALPVLCLPIYWTRNTRLADEARLSANAMARIASVLAERPDTQAIVVHDDPSARPSINSAFAAALPDAIQLVTGRQVPVQVVGDGRAADGGAPQPIRDDAEHGASPTVHFELRGVDILERRPGL